MSGARHATPADWIALLPVVAGFGDPFLQTWLDSTESMIQISWWKSKACTAHVWLTSHFLTVARPGLIEGMTEAGAAKRKKIDDLEIEYADVASAASDEILGSTNYGRLYLAMRETLLVLPIVGRRVLEVPGVL